MPAGQSRVVPYNGNRAYKYYLDGYKVNGKRKQVFSLTRCKFINRSEGVMPSFFWYDA